MTRARLPKIVTSATAVAVSSSSPCATSSMAATAEAPQIDRPVAVSSAPVFDMPNLRPSHCVPKNVASTVTTTTTSVCQPSRSTSGMASCSPSSTTPRRSSFFVARVTPGRRPGRYRPTFANSTPSTMANISGLTTGISRFSPYATATPTATAPSPGR